MTFAAPTTAAATTADAVSGADRAYGWVGSFLIRACVLAFVNQLWGMGAGYGSILASISPALQYVHQYSASHRSAIMAVETAAALLGALVWMLVVRRRTHNRELFQVARLLARMVVASTMLQYAAWKLFPLWTGPPAQLWHPLPADLITRLGDLGSTSMFWHWPGTGPTYVTFTAVVEIIGAIMMFFSRTVLLGTFLNLASLLNIAVMIQGYLGLGNDFAWTPGRRFFAIAFILYDQWPRIHGFLLRDAALVPAFAADVWRKRWMRHAATIAYVMITIRVVQAQDWIGYVEQTRALRPRWGIEAVYEVDRFTLNGKPLAEDDARRRWMRVGVTGCVGTIRTMGEEMLDFTLVTEVASAIDGRCDETVSRDSMVRMGYWARSDTMTFVRTSPDELELSGRIRSDTITATVRRVPDESLPLYDPRWFWLRS